MSEQQLADIETFAGRRITVTHGTAEGRGLTAIRLERRDVDDWVFVAKVVIPNNALWLLRDAIDAACALAARETR